VHAAVVITSVKLLRGITARAGRDINKSDLCRRLRMWKRRWRRRRDVRRALTSLAPSDSVICMTLSTASSSRYLAAAAVAAAAGTVLRNMSIPAVISTVRHGSVFTTVMLTDWFWRCRTGRVGLGSCISRLSCVRFGHLSLQQ